MLKHVETIETLIQTLVKSEVFHALLIQSPPGWSKSSTIDQALRRLKIDWVSVGSYTSPLNFYNVLVENPSSVIVLDDSGVFNDAKTLAILKAATWPTSGGASDDQACLRRVCWGTTSEKALAPSVIFRGKIIALTNVLPESPDVLAFLSRCFNYRLALSESEIRKMLVSAANSVAHFRNVQLAQCVAQFLIGLGDAIDLNRVNLRTLQLGYELASQSSNWREVLPLLLPKKSQKTLPSEEEVPLINPTLPVRRQIMEFQRRTGKSRRTYYNHKRKLGLTRPYRQSANSD